MAVSYPHESLIDSHQDGCTEGWIAELVCALIKAKQRSDLKVIETGGFKGTTSAWILLTLEGMGGGNLTVYDIDPARADGIRERLKSLKPVKAGFAVWHSDVMPHIAAAENGSIDVAFIDDDHQKHHVEQEINALWPKMSPGGIMCFHDVWGVCDLQSVVKKYGGVALDLPRLGPAGGLGIIQVPS